MYWSVTTLSELIIPSRFKYATTANPITYTDCSFTKITEEQPDPGSQIDSGGSAIRLFSQAPLSVTNCMFAECKTKLGSGGAILITSRDYDISTTATIEGSKFVECTSVSKGGAIAIITSGSHTVTRSSFTSCQAGGSGGAAFVHSCTVSFSEFVSNTALIECGALFASTTSLMICHFEGNTAQQDPDWAVAFPLNSLSTAFGCTQSSDSEVTDDVLFVVSGVDGGDCSFSSPCNSLSAALLKVGATESKKIKLGTGYFGEVHIEASSKPTICGHYRKEEWDSTQTPSSFSLILDCYGDVTLTDLNLVPLTGASLVQTTVDTNMSLNNLMMIGVDGISSTPFMFSAGTVTFTLCHFDTLSSMKCSLISVSDTAEVEIEQSLFLRIESSSSVISVVDGSLTLNHVIFRHLTRTSGLGGAALDCERASYLTIHAQFSYCHSKTGLCGAIHLNVTDLSTIHFFESKFLLNRGRDDSVAHDIHQSTITVADLPSFDRDSSSLSHSPHVADESGGFSSFQPLSIFIVFDDADYFQQIAYSPDSYTPSDVEALDLSTIVNENTILDLNLCTTREEMTFIRPVQWSEGIIDIRSSSSAPNSPLTQSSQTDGTLFSMQSGSSIFISSCVVILSTKQTDPMITLDSTSSLSMSNSILSSDGGLSNRAFCQSKGMVMISNTSIVSITFATRSCFETTGGYFNMNSPSSFATCCVTNLSTSGNGARVNGNDADVFISVVPIVDCHASNGGAVFAHNCSLSLFDSTFFRCSATQRGGAVYLENRYSENLIVYVTLHQIVDCSADLGGGLYICSEVSTSITIGASDWNMFQSDFSYPAFSGCKARKGSGAFIDGDATDGQFFVYAEKYSNNSFAEGSDLFFSKTFADTHPDLEGFLSNLCENHFSLSGRSFDDEGQYRHIEVEGYPQLSRNLPPPTMEVNEDSNQSEPPTVPGPVLDFNSLSYYLPYIHTQTDTGKYLPVPIYLMSTLFFFETGTVTRQAIVLMMSNNEWSPVEIVEVKHGEGPIETGIPFVEVDEEGSMEFSTTKFEWTIDNHLCRLVSPSAHSSITGCEFTIQLSMSVPLVECESGTLVITSSSFTMQAPSTAIFHPIVSSSSLSSHASNGKSGIEIEMSEVSFHDMTVQPSIAGVVVLADADRIRLDRVHFVNVVNTEGQDGTRIVVHGQNLGKVIECVPNSEFPRRGGDVDNLYKSLDEDEATSSLFHSPTLLLYLSFFTAPTILVHSIGRDGPWCGDVTFPCASLDEADLHLADSVLCTIAVVDATQLKEEVNLKQDKTEIVSKGGDKSRVDVSESGSLVNAAANLAHSLHLDALAFSLPSDRSIALLQSRSGMLTVTSCSFSSSSSSDVRTTHSLIACSGGSLIIEDSSFSWIVGNGDGSVVSCYLVGGSEKVEIVRSVFTNCGSIKGNGGVLWISCSSEIDSSSLIVGGKMTNCWCGDGKKGEWVFVEGHSLSSLISEENWEELLSSLVYPSDMNKLWGIDKAEKPTSRLRSISLLSLFERNDREKIFIDGQSRAGIDCGWDESRGCETVSKGMAQRKSSVTELIVVSRSNMGDAMILSSESVCISSHTSLKRGELVVSDLGTRPIVGLFVVSSCSVQFSSIELTMTASPSSVSSSASASSSFSSCWIVFGRGSSVSFVDCVVSSFCEGLGLFCGDGESSMIVEDVDVSSSSFLSPLIRIGNGSSSSIRACEIHDVVSTTELLSFCGFESIVLERLGLVNNEVSSSPQLRLVLDTTFARRSLPCTVDIRSCRFSSSLSHFSTEPFVFLSLVYHRCTLIVTNTTLSRTLSSSTLDSSEGGLIVYWKGSQPTVLRRNVKTSGCGVIVQQLA